MSSVVTIITETNRVSIPVNITPPIPPQTGWAPVGTLPLSDAAAAARVIHRPEQRPVNISSNLYVPSDVELAAFQTHPSTTALNDQLRKYVTGRPGLPNPSTDDLIQWAAHKWGIPEDWIRAEAIWESHWTQPPVGWGYGLGDKATVTAAQFAQYPPAAQIDATALTVYQSMGIMQCRWDCLPYEVNASVEPLRWKSTAFNLDYYAHYVRWLYDGSTVGISWIPNIYKGNGWASIGGWYGGSVAAQNGYVAHVQSFLASKPWLQPGF